MSVQTEIDRIVYQVGTQAEILEDIALALRDKAAGSPTGTAETWVFTMEDDTEVEKVVYVDA